MYTLQERLDELPLIAILRGLHPKHAVAMGDVLIRAGFRIIEVPLNSPEPYESIHTLATAYGSQVLIGAGTVLSTDDVHKVRSAGGRLIVMPHCDTQVITAAKQHGLICIPGAATPSEGFAALHKGADALKLFPAEQVTPAILKSWRAVFSASVNMLPVGGITLANMADYFQAGANGFGLGSALFKAGMTAVQVQHNAEYFVSKINRLRGLS